MAYIVGLTGGIASGKSTVANLFAELGVAMVDADIVAREVVAKGSPLLTKIAEHFGHHILTAEGELDRPQLRKRIFADPLEKTWLNQLLHPAIRTEMLKQLAEAHSPYVLFVVPLLIENNLTELCDRVLVVDVLPEIQLERALKRDGSELNTIRNIIDSQVSREVRLQYADDILENNQPLAKGLESLKAQVKHLHQHYLAFAKEKECQISK